MPSDKGLQVSLWKLRISQSRRQESHDLSSFASYGALCVDLLGQVSGRLQRSFHPEPVEGRQVHRSLSGAPEEKPGIFRKMKPFHGQLASFFFFFF